MLGYLPQGILILLLAASVIHDFLNWGKPRSINFWHSLLGTTAVMVLLILGGFFG